MPRQAVLAALRGVRSTSLFQVHLLVMVQRVIAQKSVYCAASAEAARKLAIKRISLGMKYVSCLECDSELTLYGPKVRISHRDLPDGSPCSVGIVMKIIERMGR